MSFRFNKLPDIISDGEMQSFLERGFAKPFSASNSNTDWQVIDSPSINNFFTSQTSFQQQSPELVEKGQKLLDITKTEVPRATEAAFNIPGRFAEEQLKEQGGLFETIAPVVGLGVDIAAPFPGEKVKAFKGLKNLSTKLLESFRGLSEKIKLGRVEEIINLTKKQGLKSVEENIFRESLVTKDGLVDLPKTAAKVEEKLVSLTPTPVKIPYYSSIGEGFIGEGKYGEIVYQSPIKTSAGNVHYPPRYSKEINRSNQNFPNYFSHIRYEDMADGKTRKILETQSDLFQKESFEAERALGLSRQETQLALRNKTKASEIVKRSAQREEELQKLQPYSSNDPLAHLRTFREEVKRAAKDGKDTLLIPSGETAMKIEGLTPETRNWRNIQKGGQKLKTNDLKVGLEISEPTTFGHVGMDAVSEGSWIITDVLGDGKFKAVPKSLLNSPTLAPNQKKKLIEAFEAKKYDMVESFKETFDISGKVDTQHFVYKLNEEAIPKEARKMGLNVEGKVSVDNGEWWKINIPKERAKFPVEAFSVIPLLGIKKEEEK